MSFLTTFGVGLIDPTEKQVVLTMSLQSLDMGIHDIMYQVFQEYCDIAKLMVHNEVQEIRELETKQSNSGDNFLMSATQQV